MGSPISLNFASKGDRHKQVDDLKHKAEIGILYLSGI